MLLDTPNLNVDLFLQDALSIRNCVFLLRSNSRLPKKAVFICFNKRHLKMIENAFCFMSKALFVLKFFNFFAVTFSVM